MYPPKSNLAFLRNLAFLLTLSHANLTCTSSMETCRMMQRDIIALSCQKVSFDILSYHANSLLLNNLCSIFGRSNFAENIKLSYYEGD